jgi:hypothetical protein
MFMLHARKTPCAECPWRKDVKTGHFPPEAYERLANTNYDMADKIFQCHDTTDETPLVCAGFLERGADHNMTVRVAYMRGEIEKKDRSGGHKLFDNYVEMAIANGVDPDNPVLKSCRHNSE